jgi:light-regulated signal transduction histidine kinase (bacteriophytochrome)
MAAVAHRQGTRMSRLVRELLDATRIDRGTLPLTPERVELGALVRDVLTTYAAELAQARCPVTVEQAARWWAGGTSSGLHQLLLNLLSNAAKFGPRKPIEIRIEPRPSWPAVGDRPRHRHLRRGAGARCSSATSAGVSSEHYGGPGAGPAHLLAHRAGARRLDLRRERAGPGRHLHRRAALPGSPEAARLSLPHGLPD